MPVLGHEIDLLHQYNRLVCRRKKITKSQVHGRPVKDGWVPVMVTDIISKNKVESWQEYPTHSGEVEVGRFAVWPTDYIRHQQSGHKPNASEAEVLKDDLHPNQYLSRVPTFNTCIRSKLSWFFSANRTTARHCCCYEATTN